MSAVIPPIIPINAIFSMPITGIRSIKIPLPARLPILETDPFINKVTLPLISSEKKLYSAFFAGF